MIDEPVTRWNQADRHALVVQPGRQAVQVIRTVHIVLDVFLARPDDLQRALGQFGEGHRLDHVVDFQPAPEAAAEVVVVHLDLLDRQAGRAWPRRPAPAPAPGCRPTARSRPARRSTVQFIGSMVAWARKGSS
jgi:hypothetical protein